MVTVVGYAVIFVDVLVEMVIDQGQSVGSVVMMVEMCWR